VKSNLYQVLLSKPYTTDEGENHENTVSQSKISRSIAAYRTQRAGSFGCGFLAVSQRTNGECAVEWGARSASCHDDCHGVIVVGVDKAVSGSVTVSGLEPTMAHIHEGAAPNANGPVIVPLAKTADNVWSVPAGAKLSDSQFESFKKGNLYVNVHSATNKGGEIRGQMKP
jgi:hypothetical protein